MTAAKVFAALAAGMAAAELTKKQNASILLPLVQVLEDKTEAEKVFKLELNEWVPPESAGPYLYLLNRAEIKHGLPENLLVRVAYQESRFRDDIVNGETLSSAGAVGIMQIVPRWHPDVNPLDVGAAIDYAGRYLRQLYDRFGSWRMALAAYNWGQGNLSRQGFESAPKETRDYVEQIAGDVLRGYA